ncbi:MAG: hypothetical protein H3C69_04915 [Candidatus Promineofilum sp.]|nr:hypothetical protein [Promineifilum sp.]
MSLMTSLFNVLALLYVGRAVQLLVRVTRDWSAIRQEPLTWDKQRLAEQAAFFLGVPPAVFVHELAHALAVWGFGGQVVEFGYRVFWGYVVPQGTFTSAQNWIIAVAGTLGSLGFGAAVWLLLRRHSSRTLQYFGLRTFRFQIYFALLYYPIFTLFLPVGDWRTIYNFNATPVLSAGTAAVHALFLLLFWMADRRGAFEMVAFESTADQAAYETNQTLASMGNPQARFAVISALWAGGARREARRALDSYLADHPQAAEGYLMRAVQVGGGTTHVGKEAYEAAGRALELGLHNPDQQALARQLRAYFHLERGDGAAAGLELDAALTRSASYDPGQIAPIQQAELHKLRSQAYRRQGQYEAAYAEIETALRWAEEMSDEQLIQRYTAEKAIIEKHSDRVSPTMKQGDEKRARPLML